MDANQRRARLERLTDQVGLRREALMCYPHEFSGFQRQRIAIAHALAVQQRHVTCDEPTSALDVSVHAQILNLLRELQRDLGVSYLFMTHNIGVVETIADWLLVMKSGRIVEQGACAEVLARPARTRSCWRWWCRGGWRRRARLAARCRQRCFMAHGGRCRITRG